MNARKGATAVTHSVSAPRPVADPAAIYEEATALLRRGQHVAAQQLLLPLWQRACRGSLPDDVPPHFPTDVGATIAHCLMLDGDCEHALAIIGTCKQMFAVSPEQAARLMWTASTAHMFLGNYEDALRLGRAAGDNEQADPVTRMNALAYVAAMYSETGQHGQASTCLQSAQALLTRFPDPGLYSLVQAVHAKFELEQHDPLEALRYTERALAAASESPVALNRTILYWMHARALGALGRWHEALTWLDKIDPDTLNYWEEIRVEAVRINAYVHTGQRQKALQRIETVLSRHNPAYPAQEYTALVDLLDAADTAGCPRVATRLAQLEEKVPAAFVVTRARVAWIKARHAFHRGEPYIEVLARFVRLCEQHRLPALLGHAARQAPALFVDGMAAGVSSPLYAAVMPELSAEQLERLAAIVTSPDCDETLRNNVFQVLVRQPDSTVAVQAAEALLQAGPSLEPAAPLPGHAHVPPAQTGPGAAAQPSLEQAARRLLQTRCALNTDGRPAAFRLCTFGKFALLHGADELGPRLRHRARDLFVMLMVAGADPVHRVHVQEMFWPHLRPRDAANNLRVVVHNLRHVLASVQDDREPHLALRTDPDGSLRLVGVEHVTWDARELLGHVAVAHRCAAAGQYEEAMAAYTQAVTLYRGMFMADAACDAAFAVERGFYARTAQEARLDLAALHLDHGDPAEALLIAERATEADPLDELAHQLVMRAHAALGYPHRVTAAYARYEQIVAAELGGKPPAATVQLYKRLLGSAG